MNTISIEDYYPFTSIGTISYDPKRGKICDPNWAILCCDEGIIDYYRWFLLRWGVNTQRGSLWGSHVSFVKGQVPPQPKLWKKYEGEKVKFRYSNNIRFENGLHAWIDVYCPRLHEIREELGFPALSGMSLHLTLGRLVYPAPNVKYVSRYRPYLENGKIKNGEF